MNCHFWKHYPMKRMHTKYTLHCVLWGLFDKATGHWSVVTVILVVILAGMWLWLVCDGSRVCLKGICDEKSRSPGTLHLLAQCPRLDIHLAATLQVTTSKTRKLLMSMLKKMFFFFDVFIQNCPPLCSVPPVFFFDRTC